MGCTSSKVAQADAPGARPAAVSRDVDVTTVSERARPDATLLRRLLDAIKSIGPERWRADAATPRVPVEARAMSWQFLIDMHASLAAELGDDAMRELNSYQTVGDKDLAGEWQSAEAVEQQLQPPPPRKAHPKAAVT